MADKDKNEQDYYYEEEMTMEDELEGGESESTLNKSGSSNMKSTLMDYIKNKRVLVISGLILAIIIVYYIITPGEQQQVQQAEQQQQMEQQQTQEQGQQQEQQAQVPQQPIAPTEQQAAEDQSVEQIQKAQDKHAKKIKALSNQVNNLQRTLNRLTKFTSEIQASIDQMTKRLDTLHQQQRSWISAQKAKQKAAKQKAEEKIYYHVRAIQPGIAWLKATDGKEIIVRKGDRIKNYGRVKMIDPIKGIVATSTGAVFEYGQ